MHAQAQGAPNSTRTLPRGRQLSVTYQTVFEDYSASKLIAMGHLMRPTSTLLSSSHHASGATIQRLSGATLGPI